MGLDIAEKLFPGTKEKVSRGICPTCNEKVGSFRDGASRKEHKISGMCQKCQNSVFGWGEWKCHIKTAMNALEKAKRNVGRMLQESIGALVLNLINKNGFSFLTFEEKKATIKQFPNNENIRKKIIGDEYVIWIRIWWNE